MFDFEFLPFALGLGLGATVARPRYYPSAYAYAPYPYGEICFTSITAPHYPNQVLLPWTMQ